MHSSKPPFKNPLHVFVPLRLLPVERRRGKQARTFPSAFSGTAAVLPSTIPTSDLTHFCLISPALRPLDGEMRITARVTDLGI